MRNPIAMLIRPLCVLVAMGHAAAAQEPVPAPAIPSAATQAPPATPVPDTTPVPFERPNGSLLRSATVTYDLTSVRAGQLTPLGVRTVRVTESSVAGMPAWLIAESRTGSAVATSDSLYLTRGELVPVRWSATSGRALLGASFTHDTAYGALQSYQGRSSFTIPAAGSALVTPAMVDRIVELLPLRAGYRTRVSLVVVEMRAPRVQPADLAVDRDEALSEGDHAVDCWVVTLRTAGSEERLWVTKVSPRVVKTEQAFGDAVLTAVARAPALVDPGTPAPVLPQAPPPVAP